MFLATALLYPCVLAVLCLGMGLLVDRCVRGCLAAPLLPVVGAAGLIALSQLSTYVYFLAPATPYAMAVAAAAGLLLGRVRARTLALAIRRRPWLAGLGALAYLIALAPVLAAGRTTLSSYQTLADSAVHLIGADYLIRHGQHYAHLDLRNSYGRFISGYYDSSSYPSGADTLFGGSALLLGLPLIWAFQPFNAFMLATAVGPAWMIARRLGLGDRLAALAALSAVLSAIVYAYELFGSIKEVVALPLILSLGALLVVHREWLNRGRSSAVPFALLLAAGVSALGVAFGVWALVGGIVAGTILGRELLLEGGRRASEAVGMLAAAALALLLAAWPTWRDLAGSVKVAQNIATTGNSGNLRSPLRAIQALGIWLGGSYKLAPHGAALVATHVLIAVACVLALLGAVQLLRRRMFALGAWIALMLLAWLLVSHSTTTWAAAKTLMLTSPVVLLLAWAGVASLRTLPLRGVSLGLVAAASLALVGGVLVSDALQYHVSNLAPSARYRELASLNSRFSGQGPTLFTDFDEYSMYELRSLDVGGPDFVYPPPAVAQAAGGYGEPVVLDRLRPELLAAYPLIITRRDPSESRPPAAYSLVWQGAYYEVWRRRSGLAAALRHVVLSGDPAAQCAAIGALSRAGEGKRLNAAEAPTIVSIALLHARRPPNWGHERQGLVMSHPGRLLATFRAPRAGEWQVWVQGQLMPAVSVSLDGRPIATIAGQLSGNSLVPNTVPPIPLRLSAGVHTLGVSRARSTLAPGEGGAAVLDAVFLTPATSLSPAPLRSSSLGGWRSLCGRSYRWVELADS